MNESLMTRTRKPNAVRSRLLALFVGVCSILLAVWYSHDLRESHAHGNTTRDSDVMRDIFESLSQRHDAMKCGEIKYLDFEVMLGHEDYLALRQLFFESQPETATTNAVMDALWDLPSLDRQRQWEGTLLHSDDGWKQDGLLVEDSATKELHELAAETSPDVTVIPPVSAFQISVMDGERHTLKDQRVLIVTDDNAATPPLHTFDISLAPWHEAKSSPTIPGQSIEATRDGGFARLIYRNNIDTNGCPRTIYTFDISSGYAPHSVSTFSESGLEAERLYAYGPWDEYTSGHNLADSVPGARLSSRYIDNDKVMIRVRVITNWDIDPIERSALSLQPPLQHIRIDRRNVDYQGHPDMSIVAPTEVEWVAGILKHLGTSHPDYDLTQTGTVDVDDLHYFLNECDRGVDGPIPCPDL